MVLANFMPVKAQESADNSAMAKYLEKKAAGSDLSEIYDEEGNVIAYFELFSESNPERPTPRYSSSISWTISSNTYSYGDNVYALAEGAIITVKISQSQTGASYLGLYDKNNSKFTYNKSSYTTNGWDGTMTVIKSGLYSFGIKNASSSTITYSGSYSL